MEAVIAIRQGAREPTRIGANKTREERKFLTVLSLE